MKNLVELISKFKNFIIYIFFSIVSLYLLFSNGFYHQNSFLNSSNEFMGGVHERASSLSDYLELEGRNKELRIELALSKMKLSENSLGLDDSTIEVVDSLTALQFSYRPAKVINKTTGYNKNHITVNKGSINGVKIDDGVISMGNGLVGRVSKVSKHFSLVTPIINAEFALKVSLKKNNVDGLLQWDGANISNAQVNEIGKRVNVQLGDTVVTSGSSAYLPRGVDVGFVTQIEPMGDVLNITIELKTDFTKVLDVMVISNVFRLEQLQLESNQNPEGV